MGFSLLTTNVNKIKIFRLYALSATKIITDLATKKTLNKEYLLIRHGVTVDINEIKQIIPVNVYSSINEGLAYKIKCKDMSIILPIEDYMNSWMILNKKIYEQIST